jgi:hypothetical protein
MRRSRFPWLNGFEQDAILPHPVGARHRMSSRFIVIAVLAYS